MSAPIPPPEQTDAATQAFAAPYVAFCTRLAAGRTSGVERAYLPQVNVSEISLNGSFAPGFLLSVPILRPEAAELFSQAAADLESEMTI